jgi:hypothetical protein
MVQMRELEVQYLNSLKARYIGLCEELNHKNRSKYSVLQAWQQKMNPLKQGAVDG